MLSSAIYLQQKSQELQKMNTKTGSEKEEEEDEEVALPGFRFHPTDEELLGFYLRRKVDKKLLASIDALIKQIDIYKYDPWDLPKSNGAGEKEGYFFCKRGRKYRNSIRPNRVTGSGFWKATGIDKSVYSHGGEGRDCVGLKKTLVYYRGSAGKGTKTDWMMHEFRLPTNNCTTTTTNLANAKSSTTPEAEVWTLCRIFMRNASFRKYAPDWREIANKRTQPTSTTKLMDQAISSNININYKTSISTVDCNNYVSFGASPLFMSNIQHNNNSNVNDIININKKLASVTNQYYENNTQDRKVVGRSDTTADHQQQPLSMASSSSNNISSGNDQQLLSYGDWDELRSVVDFAFDSPFL